MPVRGAPAMPLSPSIAPPCRPAAGSRTVRGEWRRPHRPACSRLAITARSIWTKWPTCHWRHKADPARLDRPDLHPGGRTVGGGCAGDLPTTRDLRAETEAGLPRICTIVSWCPCGCLRWRNGATTSRAGEPFQEAAVGGGRPSHAHHRRGRHGGTPDAVGGQCAPAAQHRGLILASDDVTGRSLLTFFHRSGFGANKNGGPGDFMPLRRPAKSSSCYLMAQINRFGGNIRAPPPLSAWNARPCTGSSSPGRVGAAFRTTGSSMKMVRSLRPPGAWPMSMAATCAWRGGRPYRDRALQLVAASMKSSMCWTRCCWMRRPSRPPGA